MIEAFQERCFGPTFELKSHDKVLVVYIQVKDECVYTCLLKLVVCVCFLFSDCHTVLSLRYGIRL